VWENLAAFLGGDGSGRALRAELRVVRAPCVPMTMQTLPGPWSSDMVPEAAPSADDSWSLPPENGLS